MTVQYMDRLLDAPPTVVLLKCDATENEVTQWLSQSVSRSVSRSFDAFNYATASNSTAFYCSVIQHRATLRRES